MKKILFITPHLSTGGLPQFLLKKIKSLKDTCEIYCIEYNDITGGVLIVQRTQIINLCGDKFYTLTDDKHKILEIIDSIDPCVIHFEEMPEYFMDLQVALKIYKKERKYFIVETSHDSSFNINNKRVFPDKFVVVSKFQEKFLAELNIPIEVIEYPISVKCRKKREDGLKFLGLDPDKKHVFHVGLFTARKNQKEFIEYAKCMEIEPIQFHCIGNMASNFKSYWEPLLENLPKNVKIWGERKDVDNFYSCMDLFLFTSKGFINDKETAPIVIKEAISYNVPSLIYNLPVYLDQYIGYKNIKYLDEHDFNKNILKIKQELGIIKIQDISNKCEILPSNSINSDIKSTIVIISSHPSHPSSIDETKKSIEQIKKLGYKVILTSHCPIESELQKMVDYVIYDKNNPMIRHNFYNTTYFNSTTCDVVFRFDKFTEENYHGLAVHLNYYNGVSLANKLGYKNAMCFNFDIIIDDKDFDKIHFVEDILKTKKAFFFKIKENEGDTYRTVFNCINTDLYLKIFRYYTPKEYNDIVTQYGISNGLEQFYYNNLKKFENEFYIETTKNETSFFPNSLLNRFSRIEYLTVLKVKNKEKFSVTSYFNNEIDDRLNELLIYVNDNLYKKTEFEIKQSSYTTLPCDFIPGNIYKIENNLYDNNRNLLYSYKKSFSSLEEIDMNGSIDFK